MNFDNSEYKIAGAYFDSTMTNLKLNRNLTSNKTKKR